MAGATVEDACGVLEQSSDDRLVFKFQKADGTVRIVLIEKRKINSEENIARRGCIERGEKDRTLLPFIPGKMNRVRCACVAKKL